MFPEQPTQIKDRHVTFPQVPSRRRTPGFAKTTRQAKLHQPQQRQRRHLNLERPLLAESVCPADRSAALVIVAHSLSQPGTSNTKATMISSGPLTDQQHRRHL
jgi:hypothetical protein